MCDYDLNDPLGIHAALDALPEERWDEFFDDWVALTEKGDFEVARVSSLALELARERIRRNGSQDSLSVAWQIVSRSLIRYLSATTTPPLPSPGEWIASNR